MSTQDGGWRIGEACLMDAPVDLERSLLMAQVFSGATDAGDGPAAVYVVAHGLSEDAAVRAMNFFASQPGLLVDMEELAADAGADMPSYVNIRFSEDARGVLSTLFERDLIRDLPSSASVSTAGWDLFCAHDALAAGRAVPACARPDAFDYRALRRKVYANRAEIEDDLAPWLSEERARLARLIADSPEGSEAFAAIVEDIDAAVAGEVARDGSFSVVVPTVVERPAANGAVVEWRRHTGRDVVVAHGLDAIQAARVLAEVSRDPESYVSKRAMVSGRDGRETVGAPYVTADGALNWISTDFEGRRDARAFENLRRSLPLSAGDAAPGSARQSLGR